MLSSFMLGLVASAAAVAATPAQHSPIVLPRDGPAPVITHADLMAVAESMPLEKRISEDFDLNHQLIDKTIFSGNLVTVGKPTKITSLKVTCKECSTRGTITASLTREHHIKPIVRFDLKGVEATAYLDLATTGTMAFTLNLFTSETPLGISIPGLKLGLLFSVDLVFSLSNSMDITGGFHMMLPDDAFFEIDVFGGDIEDKLFDGSGFCAIPITVKSGAATFKADLRLRVDLAAAAGIKKIGGGVGAGVFANLAEFVAQVNSTEECFLEAKEFFDLNVGATASAGIGAGLKTFNVVPGVSTTLLTSPTETQCILKENPAAGLEPTESVPIDNMPEPTMSGTPTEQLPVMTEAPVMQARAPASYVITTCASDIINCPPSLASIITVTETAEAALAFAAAITEDPLVTTMSPSYMHLAAMATPIVNSIEA